MSETSSQRVAIGHIFLEQGRPHLQATSHEHEIFINDYIPPLPVLRGGMLLTDGLHLRIKPSDPLLPDDRLLVEVERQTFTTAPPPHINDASESAIELGLMASRNSSSAAAVNESQGSSSAAPEAQTTTNLNEPNEPIQVALGASLPHRSSSAGATSIASSVSSSSTHPPSPSHPVSSYTFRYGEFVRASIFPLSSVAPSESSWDSSLTSDAGTMQSTDSRASGSQVEQDKYEANTSSGLAVSSIAGGAPSLVVTSVPTSVLDAASPSTSSSTDTSFSTPYDDFILHASSDGHRFPHRGPSPPDERPDGLPDKYDCAVQGLFGLDGYARALPAQKCMPAIGFDPRLSQHFFS
ncbi:unnamed protein product [Tilletia controversa]|nr:unnamed protein product [Tilletia controversa]CAD6983109.1 unnamed protein product [Tilletia controversa]